MVIRNVMIAEYLWSDNQEVRCFPVERGGRRKSPLPLPPSIPFPSASPPPSSPDYPPRGVGRTGGGPRRLSPRTTKKVPWEQISTFFSLGNLRQCRPAAPTRPALPRSSRLPSRRESSALHPFRPCAAWLEALKTYPPPSPPPPSARSLPFFPSSLFPYSQGQPQKGLMFNQMRSKSKVRTGTPPLGSARLLSPLLACIAPSAVPLLHTGARVPKALSFPLGAKPLLFLGGGCSGWFYLYIFDARVQYSTFCPRRQKGERGAPRRAYSLTLFGEGRCACTPRACTPRPAFLRPSHRLPPSPPLSSSLRCARRTSPSAASSPTGRSMAPGGWAGGP